MTMPRLVLIKKVLGTAFKEKLATASTPNKAIKLPLKHFHAFYHCPRIMVNSNNTT